MNLPLAKLCTGCGACTDVCSKGALSLVDDSCGFLHPVVDKALCTDCKMCEKVCPLINTPHKEKVKSVFLARAKDKETEEKSSSGGAFSLLGEFVLGLGGVVYGAGFDEKFNVCHKRIANKEDLKLIRGSKYVQSSFLKAAQQACEDLKAEKTVLFAGTPCQIAALKNMTRNIKKGKLFTVDFICHGVASPALFEKYREFVSGDREITKLSFRDKTESWRLFSMKIDFSDGTVYRKNVTEDPYLLAFISNVSIRNSCNNCTFLGTERVSDITLADAWNDVEKSESMNDGRGVSLVLVNNEQGEFLISHIKDKMISEELSVTVLEKIKPLNVPSKKNPLKDKYYKDMHRLSFDKLTAKYCGNSADAKLRRFVSRTIYKWRNRFE